MADLNDELRAALARKLDRAVFKGIERLTNHDLVLVFEKDGDAIELDLHADEDGLSVIDRTRR